MKEARAFPKRKIFLKYLENIGELKKINGTNFDHQLNNSMLEGGGTTSKNSVGV